MTIFDKIQMSEKQRNYLSLVENTLVYPNLT